MKKSGAKIFLNLFNIFFLLILSIYFVSAVSIDFAAPTPAENVSGNSIYVNLSSSNGGHHYSFADFDNDLVFWMKMDDNNGSVVYDNSSYGNNGNVLNGAFFSGGKFGNAGVFDGYDDYINISDSAAFDSLSTKKRMTVCVWVKPYSNSNKWGSNMGVLGQWRSSDNKKAFAIAEGIAGAGKYALYVSPDGSAWQDAQANSALTLNVWSHLCGTFDGSTIRFYVNGALQTDTGTLSTMYNPSGVAFTVGTYLFSSNASMISTLYYNGSIDDVIIFNRALSLNEIGAIYNASSKQFSNNYTSLANATHKFTGYAVNLSGDLASTGARLITTGVQGGGSNISLEVDLVSPASQVNSHFLNVTTNISANSCWFSSNNGAVNITMNKITNQNFYYDYQYGEYNIDFYCNNSNETASLQDQSIIFKRYVTFYDSHFTNSQGLEIYFDFNFNYSAEKGKLLITSDTWSSDKDSSTLHDAEANYMPRGYAVASVETRGKGSSQGSPDAFGYDCIDIHDLAEYLMSNENYSNYIDVSKGVYLTGASGAGGRTGVCTGKYPDFFVAGHSSVGVLNLSLWWETAAQSDVDVIEQRVGCDPTECPEAYLARDAGYLSYNTQTPMSVIHPIDDTRVTVDCSRKYNISMISNGKVVNYTEPLSGGHTADWTPSYSWFESHTSIPSMPSSGDLRIGGFVHTKNFSIFLDESSVNHIAYADYDISGENKSFDISVPSFNGNATITLFGLSSSSNYTVKINSNYNYLVSDQAGKIAFSNAISNSSPISVLVIPGIYEEEINETDNAPSVSLDSPTITVNFKAFISDDKGIENVSLLGDWDSGWHVEQTNSSGLNATNYMFLKELGEGSYTWAIMAYDNMGQQTISENKTLVIDF